jgi:hypothetical protein
MGAIFQQSLKSRVSKKFRFLDSLLFKLQKNRIEHDLTRADDGLLSAHEKDFALAFHFRLHSLNGTRAGCRDPAAN